MRRAGRLLVSVACVAFAMGGRFGFAEEPSAKHKIGGQVFFRGAFASLTDDRGGEVFTDTGGATGRRNDSKSGWATGAGLDLALVREWLGGRLQGQIFAEYASFSNERVVQTTSALTGAASVERVNVSQLTVAISPKYSRDYGDVRLWMIPVGLAFIVNSPPSNDTTYLDVGGHWGVGADYLLFDPVRIGADFRYTAGIGQSDTSNDYWSSGLVVGIEF